MILIINLKQPRHAHHGHQAAAAAGPCRVLRCAFQNAVSIAGIVLTTQAVLVEKIKEPKPPVPLLPGIHP